MFTKHVTDYAEAYLNGRLSLEERQDIERHLAHCPDCARYYFTIRRIQYELNPTLKQLFGQPNPPPSLQYKTRQMIRTAESSPQRTFLWRVSGMALNGAATMAIMALIVYGFVATINFADPLDPSSDINRFTPAHATSLSFKRSLTETLPPPPELLFEKSVSDALDTIKPQLNSLHERVSVMEYDPKSQLNQILSKHLHNAASPKSKQVFAKLSVPAVPNHTNKSYNASPQPDETSINTPQGMLAFASFDPSLNRGTYQIHQLDLASKESDILLVGASEPSLRRTEAGYHLAYRAWGTPARAMFSQDLAAGQHPPNQLSDFWEDAQPDWSPLENRVIFASRREQDRKWRLYTAWADGSARQELRREGKSPSFAPDGQRFVFVVDECSPSDISCGLWTASWQDAEHGSTLLLGDSLAQSPDWSPLDERIVYTANPAENWDLYLIQADESTPRRLTDHPAKDVSPTWSPDGEWVAFFSDRSGRWGVWLLHLESGHLEQLFDYGRLNLSSPDGHGDVLSSDYTSWLDEQLSWSE